jgi:hypothetical protein
MTVRHHLKNPILAYIGTGCLHPFVFLPGQGTALPPTFVGAEAVRRVALWILRLGRGI